MINSTSNSYLVKTSIAIRYLEWWVILAVFTLLIVWALPHTIALRNIALFSGAFAGLWWIVLVRPKVSISNLLPALFLLAVPLWILLHWKLFSNLKEVQWDEIDSTWLRVSIAILLGFCAGHIVVKNPRLFLFFVIGICILPTLTASFYFFEVDKQDAWVVNNFWGIFKGKFSGVYFITCQVLLGFGCLGHAFLKQSQSLPIKISIGILGGFLIACGIIDGIALRALNLVLMIGLCFTIFFTLYFLKALYQLVKRQLSPILATVAIAIMTVIIIGLHSFYVYDKLHEKKLANLLGDIQISTQLEKNQTWIRDGRPIPEPVDASGRAINGSTYERISWFIRGIQFIAQNPLGNGITTQSFGYYMRDAYPNSKALMTHSAWIDFTLGVGVPGLLFTCIAIWLCLLNGLMVTRKKLVEMSKDMNADNSTLNLNARRSGSLLSQSLANQKLIAQIGVWSIAGLFFYWMIGEVSEREYIEHYFFLISFFGSASFLPADTNSIFNVE